MAMDNDVSQSCHYKDLPNTVATQTEWPTHCNEYSSKEGIACSTEYNYSFFVDGFQDQERHTDSLKKQIEKLTLKMQIASQNIADLQEQIEYYEGKRFTLDKTKDDNDAISFYTGFQNYGMFNSVFNYLEVKASRLQYWRGQSDTNSDFKQYQTRGKRPEPKRKLTLEEEFFMVLMRLKFGLFVRDLSEKFDISVGQFSKIFTTWINFLTAELPLLFPFPSQDKIFTNMPESFQHVSDHQNYN
ncbi:unnamed protein product [Mytilus coruscus]|uniref:Transposase Helix-turn-helix domain-containing protein n=1 Tax=Mytilus coruscus TaxID=42192 RepID=A0A6J8DDI2_MYTCO|nr:unnamed protein product [Mytilus coruscus]